MARTVDQRIPRARSLRRNPTDAERKLWQRLRRPGFAGAHFRRQATIGPYYADFACHSLRLVIEIDGGQHDGSTSDVVRTKYLNAAGYRVLRFWNNDVLQNIDGVLQTIVDALPAADPPPPPPPPPGG
ncbi:DUF559 domain-containing protein, partial [Rhodopseudomonas sp. BAL398]